jgi:hypothetical protein
MAYRGQNDGSCYLSQRDHGHQHPANPCKPAPRHISPAFMPPLPGKEMTQMVLVIVSKIRNNYPTQRA